jgi:hypothetical protein
MKWVKIVLLVIVMVVLVGTVNLYVYLGTYVFPIAPHWVTQLPPNPPRPKIKHGEFSFRLEYEISSEKKVIVDTLICDFNGFEVNAIGGPKRRKWRDYYKNEQGNEIFTFRNEPSRYTSIVLESVDIYKVVLSVGSAEFFLGEPEYKGKPELPFIQVYDTSMGYYKDPTQCKEFLDGCNFKVISWYCDPPIENSFR